MTERFVWLMVSLAMMIIGTSLLIVVNWRIALGVFLVITADHLNRATYAK